MEDFIFPIFILIVILLSFTVIRSVKKKQMIVGELVRRAGEALGLQYRPGFYLSRPLTYGLLDGLKITIRPYKLHDENSYTDLIRIYITHRIEAGGILLVSRETDFFRLQKQWKGEDIQVGDRDFDDVFMVNGSSPLHVSALMNEQLRKNIRYLAERAENLNLTSSWFEILLRFNGIWDEDIVQYARKAVSISQDMSRGDDARARLMENIRGDSVPGVRMTCIRHLGSHYPADGEVTALLEGALKDSSRQVRIEAARHLGYGGLEFLARMLREEHDLDEYDLLRTIKFMGEHRFAGGVPVMKEIFTKAGSESVSGEILKAFTAIGDTGLSGFLLDRLGNSNGNILDGVISALATCGTVEAVEPLLKLAKSSINPLFRSDVQKAIDGIQSRLSGADAGWLSVSGVEGTAGALSMSDAPGDGALSRAKKD